LFNIARINFNPDTMKKIYLLFVLAVALCGCNKDDDSESSSVYVNFILDNELLWNIGHDYSVGGTEEDGDAFLGSEVYIQYIGILLEDQKIKKGSELILYKDGNSMWTSDPINESCTITYHDTPYSGGDYVEIN
jgi:hypothetical protein